MLKLSDIIKSGGGNAKINRFINRYVLSKKEKKDIVDEIKTISSSSGSGSGGSSGEGNKLIEYLYLKTSLSNLSVGMLTIYLENAIILAYKGVNQMSTSGSILEISFGSSYASTTLPKVIKVLKGVFVKNGTLYDCTSFDKLVETNNLNTSNFSEITEEEYDNYK